MLHVVAADLLFRRAREKVNRPQTRRRRDNSDELMDKMRLLQANLAAARQIMEEVVRRERRKRDLAVCGAPHSTPETRQTQYLFIIFIYYHWQFCINMYLANTSMVTAVPQGIPWLLTRMRVLQPAIAYQEQTRLQPLGTPT